MLILFIYTSKYTRYNSIQLLNIIYLYIIYYTRRHLHVDRHLPVHRLPLHHFPLYPPLLNTTLNLHLTRHSPLHLPTPYSVLHDLLNLPLTRALLYVQI